MRIAVHHQLTVDLGAGHPHCVQQLLLTPRSGPTQTVASWTITVQGMERAARFDDAYGNVAHLVSQSKAEGALAIIVEGIVDTHDRNGVLGRVGGEPVPALFRRITELTGSDPELTDGLDREPRGRIAVLHGLMERLAAQKPASDAQTQTQSQMAVDGQLQSQSQDQDPASEAGPDAVEVAHRFIGAARSLDIPARYVTGYLWTGQDNTSFHAWAEAYDEALGWIAFDPSQNLCPTEHHIRLATGLDAASTLPVRSFPEGGPLSVVGLSVAAAAAQ